MDGLTTATRIDPFEQWVTSQGGPEKAASLLGLNYSTIWRIIRRKTVPSWATIIKLDDLTEGGIDANYWARRYAESH